MDSLETGLRLSLIARRSILNDAPYSPDLQEAVRQAERALYEYQLKIGSAAAYYTFERM